MTPKRKREERWRSEVISRLGLDFLDLNDEEVKEICELVYEMIPRKTSFKAYFERISRKREKILPLIISHLLEKRGVRDERELEFYVTYGDRAIIPHTSLIYFEAKKHGRKDIIALLRDLWLRNNIGFPIRCPHCAFPSVSPRFECIVCGKVLSEEEVKEAIDFKTLLKVYSETSEEEEIKRILEQGYIFYCGEDGLTSKPRMGKHCYLLELTSEENRILRRRVKYVKQ